MHKYNRGDFKGIMTDFEEKKITEQECAYYLYFNVKKSHNFVSKIMGISWFKAKELVETELFKRIKITKDITLLKEYDYDI